MCLPAHPIPGETLPLKQPSFLQRVATAPISWGVCEVPGWGHQLPPDRVLSEMNSLGFTATELGSTGWLPTELDPLRELLATHELGLLAAFIPLVLHDRSQRDAQLSASEEAAALLSAAGARYFNTAPVTSSDWEPRRAYADDEWEALVEGIAAVEEICHRHGLRQVLHEHYGCVVETAEEIELVLDRSAVSFVLDTGHMAIGGFDPMTFARDHLDRVGLVHLKDLRFAVAERLNRGELSLMEAVQHGLFPPLGDGDLAIDEVITALETAGYSGHYVVEQDCAITGPAPAAGEGPIRDVAKSVAYLQTVSAQLAEIVR